MVTLFHNTHYLLTILFVNMTGNKMGPANLLMGSLVGYPGSRTHTHGYPPGQAKNLITTAALLSVSFVAPSPTYGGFSVPLP